MAKRVNFEFTKCGHIGKGAECNRCKQGRAMVALAEAGALGEDELKRLRRARDEAYDKKKHYAALAADVAASVGRLDPDDVGGRNAATARCVWAENLAVRYGRKAVRLDARTKATPFTAEQRAALKAEGQRLLAPYPTPSVAVAA